MSQMVDALRWDFVGPCPADNDQSIIVAAYVNHPDNPDSLAQAIARFPHNPIVTINSHADAHANILDVENGAVSPSDKTTIVNWVAGQRKVGISPTIYMNQSTWPLIKSYFQNGPPMWWVAKWDGQQVIPTGANGKQYGGDGGHFDQSIMLDSWLGSIMPLTDADEPIISAGVSGAPITWGDGTEPLNTMINNILLGVQDTQAKVTQLLENSGGGGTAPKYSGTVELSPVVIPT